MSLGVGLSFACHFCNSSPFRGRVAQVNRSGCVRAFSVLGHSREHRPDHQVFYVKRILLALMCLGSLLQSSRHRARRYFCGTGLTDQRPGRCGTVAQQFWRSLGSATLLHGVETLEKSPLPCNSRPAERSLTFNSASSCASLCLSAFVVGRGACAAFPVLGLQVLMHQPPAHDDMAGW